jgi:hypothetical protein
MEFAMSTLTASFSTDRSYSSNLGLAARNLMAALFAVKPAAAAAVAANAVKAPAFKDEDVQQYLPQTGMVYSIFSLRSR